MQFFNHQRFQSFCVLWREVNTVRLSHTLPHDAVLSFGSQADKGLRIQSMHMDVILRLQGALYVYRVDNLTVCNSCS